MKTLLAVLFILAGPLASAETPIPNDIFVVEADFKVTFHSNEFPQVIPHPGFGDMPPPVRVVVCPVDPSAPQWMKAENHQADSAPKS